LENIEILFEIIRTLRKEKTGCVWDRRQTPETMWECLAEEVYELQEAIAKNDLDHICEEAGDVLFQLVFIIELFQEKGGFTLSDVIKQVAKKMIRRHPHVYEDASISTENELNLQWETIKALEKEKKGQTAKSALDSVPRGMSSLIRALKVSKCAVKEGFDWDNSLDVLETVKDEIKEFEAAVKSGNKSEAVMEFGDILFSLVNVARVNGFHPETALAGSTAKFEGRFRLMESELNQQQIKLETLSRDQKDLFWDQAKKSYER